MCQKFDNTLFTLYLLCYIKFISDLSKNYSNKLISTKERTVMKPTILHLAITASLATSSYLSVTAASAQQAANSGAENAQPTRVEKVEVTGSSIRRIEGETALPVSVITRDDIAKSGANSAAELLSKLSSNPGTAYQESQSVDGTNPGFAGVSLRGLGEGTTLVLLNGRRLANFAFSGVGVDLNSIPLSAVERVEILKDGASAVYGTDAIGGVINFILSKNYRGADFSVSAGTPRGSQGGQQRANVTAGFGNYEASGFSAVVSADVSKSNSLAANKREFGRTGYRPDLGIDTTSTLGTFPANIFLLDNTGSVVGVTNPAATTGCPVATVLIRDQCNYDETSVKELIPKTEKASLFGRLNFKLGPYHSAFIETAYAQNQVRSVDSPSNVSLYYLATTGAPPLVLEGTPYFPAAFAGQGFVPIGFRAVPAGNRIDTAKTKSLRLVGGLEGTVAGWDYSAGLNYSQSKATDQFDGGFLSFAKFQSAFESGLINPFGASDAAGARVYQDAQQFGIFRRGESSVTSVDAKASRDVLQMSGGALSVAFGFDARREEFDQLFNQTLASDTIGYGSSPDTRGSRRLTAVFGELSAPFAKGWEAQLAVRHDRYSDFGGSTNPKLALRWQPTKAVLVRVSAGSGFRAPSLIELYLSKVNATTTTTQSDPLRCPTTSSPTDCDAFFLATAGGNPNLRPEKSKQFALGFVLDGGKTWSASVDYWQIQKRDDIVLALDPTIFANFNEFASAITRGPATPAFPNLPGPITSVAMGYYNFGTVKTSGIDFDLRYAIPLQAAGNLGLSLKASQVVKFDRTRGAISQSSLGRADNGPPIARWRHNLSADWSFGAWNAVLTNNFMSSYRDEQLDGNGNVRRVSSNSTWDILSSYAFSKQLSFSLGVRNIFDRDPPISNQVSRPQNGYDPRFSDPRGRFYSIRLNYAMK
jgi:iron complex outermembrane recepter protein